MLQRTLTCDCLESRTVPAADLAVSPPVVDETVVSDPGAAEVAADADAIAATTPAATVTGESLPQAVDQNFNAGDQLADPAAVDAVLTNADLVVAPLLLSPQDNVAGNSVEFATADGAAASNLFPAQNRTRLDPTLAANLPLEQDSTRDLLDRIVESEESRAVAAQYRLRK